MSVRPLIGVSTSELRLAEQHHKTPYGEPARRELALGVTYFEAIERAGGLPVMLPPVDVGAVDALLDRLSGVCFSGGPDLCPAIYDAEPHPALGPTEPSLDRFELALARRADARGIPILAICRGMQLVNVVRGGSLHQHLPDVVEGGDRHRQDVHGSVATHEVAVASESRLAAIAQAPTLRVNSFHHQAIDRLGLGLSVTAVGEDGTVEAIEDPSRPLLLGVQWHAECLVGDPVQERLFGTLVEEARRRDLVGPVSAAA